MVKADFTNLFSPNIFKDNDKIILKDIKIGKPPNVYPILNDQTRFRLKKSTELKTVSPLILK